MHAGPRAHAQLQDHDAERFSLCSVNQAAFLEALARSLGVPEEAVSIAALHMQSAGAAESHLRIARRLSAQVRKHSRSLHIR